MEMEPLRHALAAMLHRFFVFQGSDRLVCTPSKLHALVAETSRVCKDAQLLKVSSRRS